MTLVNDTYSLKVKVKGTAMKEEVILIIHKEIRSRPEVTRVRRIGVRELIDLKS